MTYPKQYLYKRVVESKIFIDAHFQDDIDINRIAAEANYSKFHFIRLFKETFGYSPRQYLICKRIDHAKKLLQKNRSVTFACLDSGFSSVGSFSALFKKRTGISPSSYAKKYFYIQIEAKRKPEKFIPKCYLVKNNFQEDIL